MTLKEALEYGKKKLEEAGILEAPLDAWYLLEFLTQISRASYFGNPDANLEDLQWEVYQELIVKRSTRLPLQHITGVQEFMGYVYKVNQHVLIPRQDTEMLVEKCLVQMDDGMNVLDMCTGSGCIILSLEQLCASKGINIVGTGVDVSNEALKVANENKELNSCKSNLIQSDLFSNVTGKYHMIVSNPPYIPTKDIEELEQEVRIYDPMLALDGMEDGLTFYKKITEESTNYLYEGGWLLYEIGYDQGEAVKDMMTLKGFKDIRIVQDLCGMDRVVMGHL